MRPRSDLSRRIAGVVREQKLFKPGDTLIIGLSGGADSTALLNLLASLPEMPLRLIGAHLNHCLRGAESDKDEEFCRSLAEQYQITFESRRVEVKAIASAGHLNLEDAGRQARIAFFDELRTTWQASAVVLAHHADDQAETVLMRLLRGSGMAGLAAIPYRNNRCYVRPMLDISRAEIEAYLVEHGLGWREDVSNLDRSFLRNRLRHELLPLLEQYNPSVRSNLATTAAILSAENDLLDDLASQAAERISLTTAHGTSCTISQLLCEPPALQRRVIRLLVSRLHGNLEQISFQHVEDIRRMSASKRPNAIITLPHGIVIVKEYEALAFRTNLDLQPQAIELSIPGPGVYKLPCNALLTVESSPAAPAQFNSTCANTVYLDLDTAPFPWHVRTFLPGDRIQPLGMTGTKKVKSIFIDSKIPLSLRTRIPLVFSGNELIWVCGLTMSHTARLARTSSHIIKIIYTPPK